MMYYNYGFNAGSGFELMFVLAFLFIITTIIVSAVKGFDEWSDNNHSPRLSTMAILVAKRTNHSIHRNGANHGMVTSSTTYYVTFELESGDRIEFRVKGKEYGMLVEGDVGVLSFQGTRYLGFERTMK